MKGTFAALLAGTSVLAIRGVCGLKVHVAPNGPLGAPSPGSIRVTSEEPAAYRPGGTRTIPNALGPEYGGGRPWPYSGPDITELPVDEKAAVSEAAALSGAAQPIALPQPAAPLPGFSKLNFPLPPWLSQLINTAAGIASFMNGLGVPGAPDVTTCSSSPTLKELMVCVESAVNEGKQLFQTAQEIAVLNTRVMSGGRPADAALARLKTLASRPFAKDLMKALGTTLMCTMLMQKEMTPDRQRWQAGSIVTTVTDLPVASDVTDTKSGGFGHVNVVLPRPSRVHRSDRIIEQLNKGMDPAETLYGALGVEGRTDLRFPLSAV